jgi:4-aminobutyrate aminotransferase/(S)-3-amino-2-methylpropionate transaminase
MLNAQASANRLKILSFSGAFHGRTLGALSATRSKAIHKVDFPAFDWPVVPFPANRFPLSEYAADNQAAEARSLELVAAAFRKDPGSIAAIVVEPIQGEGGDCHASPAFFRALQEIAYANGALFIADEVQTGGGACGQWWAHTSWELPAPPDIVTFSKKLQVGGCFFKRELMPYQPYRIFNTFLGDPLRAAQFQVVAEVIERDGLLENTRITGEFLVKGLEDLSKRYPELLSQARGAGTFAAFDLPQPTIQQQFLKKAQSLGLEMGGSGTTSVRFRPALIFAPRHAAEALDRIEAALKELG